MPFTTKFVVVEPDTLAPAPTIFNRPVAVTVVTVPATGINLCVAVWVAVPRLRVPLMLNNAVLASVNSHLLAAVVPATVNVLPASMEDVQAGQFIVMVVVVLLPLKTTVALLVMVSELTVLEPSTVTVTDVLKTTSSNEVGAVPPDQFEPVDHVPLPPVHVFVTAKLNCVNTKTEHKRK